jgi:4-hydroxy-3-polyprenylbenzoate decarboxylase
MKIGLAISGASGLILGLKCLKLLAELGHEIYLVVTKDACRAAVYELSKEFHHPQAFIDALPSEHRSRVRLYNVQDFCSPLASGSCGIDKTLIVPCSMASLAAIACGLSDNLLRRMADVALKERKTLVIVPREAPFSAIHLQNMLRLSELGATIFPPMPSWYIKTQSLEEMEDVIVLRILQVLGIEAALRPWMEEYQERIQFT